VLTDKTAANTAIIASVFFCVIEGAWIFLYKNQSILFPFTDSKTEVFYSIT
jgi:hypothetical protein